MKVTVTWRQLTRNCWVANLPGGVSLSVTRKRGWKRHLDLRPFKIAVLGNHYPEPNDGNDGYEALENAQLAAELIAKKIVRGLMKWATGAK